VRACSDDAGILMQARGPDKLRSSVLRAATLGLLVLASTAVTGQLSYELGGWYAWKSSAAFTVAMVLILGLINPHHPFERFGTANQITTIRLMAAALLAGLIGEAQVVPAMAAASAGVAVAAALDGVDGWFARRTRMASTFGARFDMETDAALIMIASIVVWQGGKAGVWVLAGGLLRYAFLMAGWWLPWMNRPLTPTLRARTIAVVHVVALCVALAPIVPVPWSAVAAASSLALLSWSFAVDVGRLWRMNG
jgi:phosphatidylglycerophosphate synthase